MQTQRNPYPLVELPKASYAPYTSSNHRNDKKVYNLHVPLPLAVGTIMTRAECRWYRTLAQMRIDIDLLSDNAVLVYQTGHSVRNRAADITHQLHRILDAGDLADDRVDEAALEDSPAGAWAGGTSEAGTSRAILGDSPDVPAARSTRHTREAAAEELQAPHRETRRRAARAASPEPESPDECTRRSRASRKRRICTSSWDGAFFSEERSQEPIDRPRRNTRQRVTYA